MTKTLNEYLGAHFRDFFETLRREQQHEGKSGRSVRQLKIAKAAFEYLEEVYGLERIWSERQDHLRDEEPRYRILAHDGKKWNRADCEEAISISLHVDADDGAKKETLMMQPDVAVVDTYLKSMPVVVEIENDDEISQKHIVGDIATTHLCAKAVLRDGSEYTLDDTHLFVVLCASFYGNPGSRKPVKIAHLERHLRLGPGCLYTYHIAVGRDEHDAFETFVKTFEEDYLPGNPPDWP